MYIQYVYTIHVYTIQELYKLTLIEIKGNCESIRLTCLDFPRTLPCFSAIYVVANVSSHENPGVEPTTCKTHQCTFISGHSTPTRSTNQHCAHRIMLCVRTLVDCTPWSGFACVLSGAVVGCIWSATTRSHMQAQPMRSRRPAAAVREEAAQHF